MSSTTQRQREAARARLERQMAEKLAEARKKKQRTAIAGAATALLLIVAGVVWAVSVAGGNDPAPEAASDPGELPICVWTDKSAAEGEAAEGIVDVGAPPTGLEPHSGTQTMTISTNFGDITAELDLSKVPCAAASFTHLTSKQFFDGTKCHRMFPGMLQCGDPTAKGDGYRESDGKGGPSFSYALENLPNVIDQSQAYPEGSIAMANGGPGSENGSQFFIIYETVTLASDYTLLGKITSGLNAVQKATEAGHDSAFEPTPGGGHPTNDININTLRMSTQPPRS